jgi:hypothetical protein
VDPLLIVLAGIASLAAGFLVLHTFGPRFRVGRLLASTPRVSVAEAIALADRGLARYVRVVGRIDSDEDFEDEHHRPLVFRRTRLEARVGRRWVPFDERREAVRFELREGLAAIEIDADALDVGLVVLPREASGTAADLGARRPDDLPPDRPVRLRIEQVSAVEHATAMGVPVRRPDGRTRLAAGLGRPLVLTTLEPAEAIRVLTGGRDRRLFVAAALLAAGLVLLVVGLGLAVAQVALAATPTPAPGGDPRSPGQGPGLVGQPLVAIGAVVAIGLLALVATLVYVRLTGGPRTPMRD